MSTHIPSKQYPPRIYQRRFARNGHPVSAVLMRRLGDALMHDVAWRGQKVVLQYTRDWNNLPTPETGTLNLWRARFRAPYGAARLKCHVAMHPVSSHYGAVDPRVDMQVTIAGGATTTSNPLHFASMDGSGGITAAVPDSVYWGFIPNVTIAGGTAYELLIRAHDWAIPLACMAWTDPQPPMNDDDLGVVDPTPYSVSMPITDANHSDLLVAGNNLWDRGSATILAYTSDRSAVSFTTSSTTFTNILDGVSTTVSGTSPGFTLNLANKGRQSVSTVPVVIATYGQRTAGGGGQSWTLRLTDGTTNYDVTASAAAAGWYTGTANLPATDGAKYDLQGAVTAAANTGRIDAVSVYQER